MYGHGKCLINISTFEFVLNCENMCSCFTMDLLKVDKESLSGAAIKFRNLKLNQKGVNTEQVFDDWIRARIPIR